MYFKMRFVSLICERVGVGHRVRVCVCVCACVCLCVRLCVCACARASHVVGGWVGSSAHIIVCLVHVHGRKSFHDRKSTHFLVLCARVCSCPRVRMQTRAQAVASESARGCPVAQCEKMIRTRAHLQRAQSRITNSLFSVTVYSSFFPCIHQSVFTGY